MVGLIAASLVDKAEVRYWDHDKVPGADAWKTIYSWIREADLVMAVVTEITLSRAMAVGNEIGYAKAFNKLIVPIVASGISSDDLGCLIGLTHTSIDRNDFKKALATIHRVVEGIAERDIGHRNVLLAFAGILGFAMLANAGERPRRGRKRA